MISTSKPMLGISRPSSWRGLVAASALLGFYVTVVAVGSGSLRHLGDQIRSDWYFIAVIVAGFGLQVAFMAELRRRHRLHLADMAAGGTGVGASSGAMIACCAHHIADLAPLAGATGAATLLVDYRMMFMLGGVGINAIAVVIAARRLRRLNRTSYHSHTEEDVHSCALV